jgi:hypothetical protein
MVRIRCPLCTARATLPIAAVLTERGRRPWLRGESPHAWFVCGVCHDVVPAPINRLRLAWAAQGAWWSSFWMPGTYGDPWLSCWIGPL